MIVYTDKIEERKRRRRQYEKEYYQDNKERIFKYQKEWARKNPEKRRLYRERCERKHEREYAKKRPEWARIANWGLKAKTLLMLGGCCSMCGCVDIRLLSVNHINGGGKKHVLKLGGSHILYRNIIKNAEKIAYNVLCLNCQRLFEFRRGRYRLPKHFPTDIFKYRMWKSKPC